MTFILVPMKLLRSTVILVTVVITWDYRLLYPEHCCNFYLSEVRSITGSGTTLSRETGFKTTFVSIT